METKRKRCDKDSSISRIFITNRSGQITIFIIIGILLVLALLIVVFVKRESLTVKPEELLPTSKGAVASYISSCIKQLGEDALSRLGEQGGYVILPQDIANNGYVHLKTSPFSAVPYWAYGQTIAVPPLTTVKAQIDSSIQQHLRECVLGTGAFQQSFNLVEKSDISVNTNIAENNVVFNVRWSIEVQDKQGEKITDLIDHIAESPVKLKQLYDTASRIITVEMRDLKLEDITQDLIALEHPDVPVSGFEISCTRKEWNIATVKQRLQDLLRVNIRELKTKGTDFVEFPEELPYYANHYVWDLGDDLDQKKVNVQFQYNDNYPFTFDVQPRSGNKLMSGSLGGGSNPLISFFCMQNWKFVYDISYPVLVTLQDETTNYQFKMAFTVHLKHNIPDRSDVPVQPLPSVTAAGAYSDLQFCNTRNIPTTITTAELVDNAQGVSNSEPLDNVNISYNCLQYRCDLGQTDYDYASMGDVAAKQINLPYCANAIIRAQKQGYKDGWINLVTKPGAQANVKLIPVVSFPVANITILQHEFNSPENIAVGKPLDNDETVIIKLRSIQDDPQTNQPLEEATIVISPDLPKDAAARQPLEFLAKADFTYTLDITVLKGENFVGGYRANWTVPWDALASAQKLTFHTLTSSSSSDLDLFGVYSDLGQNSKYVPPPALTQQ